MLVILAMTFGNVAGAIGAVEYSVINLDTLGGTGSIAEGLNDSGQVVGDYENAQGTHGFIYSNGSMTDLGALPAPFNTYTVAVGVSATGQVVGTALSFADSSIPNRAFTYSNGSISDLGTLDPPYNGAAQATAINASGQVVGFSTAADGAPHAFEEAQGRFVDLGTLGGSFSLAFGINSNGDVVGKSAISGDVAQHAFLYQNNQIFDLGTLGGDLGQAEAVNNADQITGYSSLADNSTIHAFLYGDLSMKDLGSLPGYDQSFGTGINNAGEVVGLCVSTVTGTEKAFLYDNGSMIDLNSVIAPNSGWQLEFAYAINNNGQIVGYGFAPNGTQEAFLLTPLIVSNPPISLPEPNQFSIAAIAIAWIMSFRRPRPKQTGVPHLFRTPPIW